MELQDTRDKIGGMHLAFKTKQVGFCGGNFGDK